MEVWEVLGKRTEKDDWVVVGGVKAPDVDIALLLARETHFRHKEGVAYAVRRRGEEALHQAPYSGQQLGGVTDRSYRRQDAYKGVGARHKRVAEAMAGQGRRIDRPRPPVGRAGRRDRLDPSQAQSGDPEGLSPEDLAAHGTAG
jgi:1,2-phenylacetyl-CoA epoxidase PaaB subunit